MVICILTISAISDILVSEKLTVNHKSSGIHDTPNGKKLEFGLQFLSTRLLPHNGKDNQDSMPVTFLGVIYMPKIHVVKTL